MQNPKSDTERKLLARRKHGLGLIQLKLSLKTATIGRFAYLQKQTTTC